MTIKCLILGPRIPLSEGIGRQKLSIMRKLSGITRREDEQILKINYQETVWPQPSEYGSSSWSTSTKTNLASLDQVQKHALLIITGATKSTPVNFRYINSSKTKKNHDPSSKAAKNLPIYDTLKGSTENRLTRSSFVHEANNVHRFPSYHFLQ